jgi:processive 1,2-diacylglycerol beta-glucosyltransferase
MILLRDKETGRKLGTITEDQLEFLVDQLEEEWDEDTDYWVDRDTLDMLEERGIDPEVLEMLGDALGDRDGLDVQWSRG